MPAVSLRQQRAMQYARAVKRGQATTDSATIRKLAGSLTEAQLGDFAARTETLKERHARIRRGLARKLARG